MSDIRQALDHARYGEFAPLRDEAANTTAEAFAAKHNTTTRPWGRGGAYTAVNIDGTDYLWKSDSGVYDGWDRPLYRPHGDHDMTIDHDTIRKALTVLGYGVPRWHEAESDGLASYPAAWVDDDTEEEIDIDLASLLRRCNSVTPRIMTEMESVNSITRDEFCFHVTNSKTAQTTTAFHADPTTALLRALAAMGDKENADG